MTRIQELAELLKQYHDEEVREAVALRLPLTNESAYGRVRELAEHFSEQGWDIADSLFDAAEVLADAYGEGGGED